MNMNYEFWYGSASASGSVSLRYGSEDPDPHLDPYKNVSDPEHCGTVYTKDA
jgi:hypothetical protein